MSEFNEAAWVEALETWEEVSKYWGFEDRKTAFLQGYYIAVNKRTKIEEE